MFPALVTQSQIDESMINKQLEEERMQQNIKRMYERTNKKKWVLYPEDKSKQTWDLIITITLLFTCFISPYDLAFQKENAGEGPLSIVIDIIFWLDIIINFFSAFYQKDMIIVETHKEIAKNYLTGWFLIDLFAILPIDEIINISQAKGANQLSRISKFGRLYKLIKLLRLLRILKLIKDKNKFMKVMTEMLQMSLAIERMIFFLLVFALSMHLAACLFLIIGSIQA